MAADGGRSGARGLRYQYLRTLESLLDVVERDDGDVVSVHVEGLAGPDGRSVEGIDYELADGHGQIVSSVQVKSRAPGYAMGAGVVFGTLVGLVREREAWEYLLLTNAMAGESVRDLLSVLSEAPNAGRLRSMLDAVLASVSANRQRAYLSDLNDDQLLRLRRARAIFDSREEEEIRGDLTARLRAYRNKHSAGLGDESAGLMIGYLLSEIFGRAADAAASTISVSDFEALVMVDGATLAGTLGCRDWGVVVGRVPVTPDVRRSELLDRAAIALPLPPGREGVTRCTFTGLSGIGKTSLAAGYVLDRADLYDVIFWVDAENDQTLASSFHRIFRYLRGGTEALAPAEPAQLRDAVHDELSRASGTWLMVLDNCVRPRLAEPWIPGSGSGHVIITTTDSSQPPKAGMTIEVGRMSLTQATALLARRLTAGCPAPLDAQLEVLANELECWPLALELASAYLHSSGLGTAGIREYLRRLKLRSLGDPRSVPPDYPRTLIQAIRLCLDRVHEQATLHDREQAPAVAALALISLSAYVAAQRVPVRLLLTAAQIEPGQDAFHGMAPVVADDTDCPAEEVVAVLRTESLAGIDELLPADGLDPDHDRRLDLTIAVNSVLQEVIRAGRDHDPKTQRMLNRLAWHTERWMKAAFDLGSRARAAVLAAHATAIETHASRLGVSTDFIAYLRGNLGFIYLRQRETEKAGRLLRSEIAHFSGRTEEHACVLACQASIQLAILLADGEPPPVDEIIELLENAYKLVYESALEAPEGAVFLARNIIGVLKNLELNHVATARCVMLAAAVQDLLDHLPATPVSAVGAALGDAEMALHEQDPGRASEICREVLAELASADEVDLNTLARCEARRILIEALIGMNELDAASAELDLFLENARPPAFFIAHIEQLVHNAGMRCAALSLLTNAPLATDLLERLLGNGNAELICAKYPGETAVRISFLQASAEFARVSTEQTRQNLKIAAASLARYSSSSSQGAAWAALATGLARRADNW